MCHRMGTRKCVKVFLAHFSSVVRLKAPVFSSYIIYHISLVFVKDSILGNWPKYERRRREKNWARSASAEGARVRRRRKASAASLSPNQLTISGAKLLQRPHKLDKLQFLGLWHRLIFPMTFFLE